MKMPFSSLKKFKTQQTTKSSTKREFLLLNLPLKISEKSKREKRSYKRFKPSVKAKKKKVKLSPNSSPKPMKRKTLKSSPSSSLINFSNKLIKEAYKMLNS